MRNITPTLAAVIASALTAVVVAITVIIVIVRKRRSQTEEGCKDNDEGGWNGDSPSTVVTAACLEKAKEQEDTCDDKNPDIIPVNHGTSNCAVLTRV